MARQTNLGRDFNAQQNVVMENDELVVESIKDFCTKNGFTQIVTEVRMNKNGYPFITFIDANNQSENIYFSKPLAEKSNLQLGQKVTKEMVKDWQIGYTINAQDEERIKIVGKSELRAEVDDLFD